MIDRMSTRTMRVHVTAQPTQLGPRQSTRFSDADLAATNPQDMMRELVGPDLQRVESTLVEVLGSQYPEVNELASRAASLGGKRLRPCLSLLSAMAVGRCE
jgi:hypothetical protein